MINTRRSHSRRVWRRHTATRLVVGCMFLLPLLAAGCATRGSEDAESSPTGWETAKAQGARVGSETMRLGAAATSRLGKIAQGTGKAVKQVSLRYHEPDPEADYGPAPKNFVRGVKRHFEQVLRYRQGSAYRFGELSRGYMHNGLARGGEVAWYGYLLNVRVESKRWLAKRPEREDFVVRIRDGEVVDVHSGSEPALLHRLRPLTAKADSP